MSDAPSPNRLWIVLVGGTCALFGIFALVYLLVWRVPNPHGAAAEVVLRNAVARLQARDQIAPSDNGYTLLDSAVNGTSGASVAALCGLAQYSVGKRSEIVKLLNTHPGGLTRQVKDARSGLKVMRDALARPAMTLPLDWSKGLMAAYPNYIGLRKISQHFTVLGMYDEMHGKYAEAAEAYALGVAYGLRVQREGPVIQLMIGVAIQRIALWPLVELLSADILDGPTTRKVLAILESAGAKETDFLEDMDTEYALTVLTFNVLSSSTPAQLAQASGTNPPMQGVLNLFAFLKGPVLNRERILYQNQYVEVRPFLERLDVAGAHARQNAQPSLAQRLRPSLFAGSMSLEFSRVMAQFKVSRTLLGAAEILAALRLYFLDHREYPAQLSALAPKYLGRVPLDLMNGGKPFSYRRVKRTYTLTTDSPDYALIGLPTRIPLHDPGGPVVMP